MAIPDAGERGAAEDHTPAVPQPALLAAVSPAHAVAQRLPSSPSGPSVTGLVRALQRRLGLALGVGLLCALLGAGAAWFFVPPSKYTTRATLRVAMFQPKIIFETGEAKADYRTFQRTQMALIKSRLVLGTVLQKPEIAKLATVQEVVRSQGDPIEWLEQQLAVEFPGNSEILHVSMSGARPHDLQVLVNTVVDVYMNRVVEDERNERKTRIEKLRQLWDRYQQDLADKRKNLRSLAVSAGSDDRQTLALKSQFAHETLAQAKQEELRVRAELARAKAELAALEADADVPAAQTVPAHVIEEYVDQDPTIAQLKSKVDGIVSRYNRARGLARSPADPSLIAVGRELEATRQALVDQKQRLRAQFLARLAESGQDGRADERQRLSAITKRIKMLEQFERDLAGDVQRLTEQIGALNLNTLDIQKDQDEIALLTDTAKKVGAEVEALGVELQAPKRVQVIDRAALPRTKDELKKVKASGIAAVSAFAFVLASVSFWEFWSRRISSVDEVVQGLGMPLVGAIPALPARSSRLRLGSDAERVRDQQSRMVESVDATRMMLLHASRTSSVRIVLVTSALAGEGKTSLSGHLATSLARAGRRTLLVDCDLRSPAVHKLFDLASGPGVCELLRGEAKLGDVCQPTRAADLFVISAGRVDVRAIQAVARGDLHAVFDALEPAYDFIVVDSAPVLPVADTLAVSQHVDAALFSILRDVSRAPMVHSAYDRLAKLGVRILGAVIAGTPTEAYGGRYNYPSVT